MRKKLYRNSDDAIIGGVCAGIADYSGWHVWLVRIVALTLLVFTNSFALLVYIFGWVFLKDSPDITVSKKERRVHRRIDNLKHSFARTSAIDDVAKRFERMEKRLRGLEAHVTSSEFKLRREFDNL